MVLVYSRVRAFLRSVIQGHHWREAFAHRPSHVRPREERDDRRDVFRLAQPLHRRHFGIVIDLVLSLAGQKEGGRGRPRRHGIYGDAASTKFLGENKGHRLHGRLGRRIDGIAGHREHSDAGRKIDDPSACAHSPGRDAQRVKGPFQIGIDDPVEQRVIRFAERNKPGLHDAGVVDEDIDAAEQGRGLVEQRGHLCRSRNVSLYGLRPSASSPDFIDNTLGLGRAAGIVYDHGKTFRSETLGDRCADASGSAGNNSYLAFIRL